MFSLLRTSASVCCTVAYSTPLLTPLSASAFESLTRTLTIAAVAPHERRYVTHRYPCRAANGAAPIVAVASRDALQAPDNSTWATGGGTSTGGAFSSGRGGQPHSPWLRCFNECLTMPVSSAKVRDLAKRWLLAPAEQAAAAAAAGGAAAATATVTAVDAALRLPSQSTQAPTRQAILQRQDLPVATSGNFSPALSSPTYSYDGASWSTVTSPWASRHGRSYQDPR